VEKMAAQWEEAPSLYLKLDVKVFFYFSFVYSQENNFCICFPHYESVLVLT